VATTARYRANPVGVRPSAVAVGPVVECYAEDRGAHVTKFFIWTGLFVGSTVAGLIPMLWGDDMLSVAGLLLSMVGGVLGIFGGWKLAQAIG
jgi:hypothetical protein